MNKLFKLQPLHTDLAILILRLMFGSLFFYYGYLKLDSYEKILPMFPDPIGIGSKLSFILVIFAELVCGFLVLTGLLTRLAIIPIFILLLVVFFIVHAKDTFVVKQLAMVHLVLCIIIFILGSGKFSLDYLIRKK